MTVIHHVTIACPICGEVQTVAIQGHETKVPCECGAIGEVGRHHTSKRVVLITWYLPEESQVEAL